MRWIFFAGFIVVAACCGTAPACALIPAEETAIHEISGSSTQVAVCKKISSKRPFEQNYPRQEVPSMAFDAIHAPTVLTSADLAPIFIFLVTVYLNQVPGAVTIRNLNGPHRAERDKVLFHSFVAPNAP